MKFLRFPIKKSFEHVKRTHSQAFVNKMVYSLILSYYLQGDCIMPEIVSFKHDPIERPCL